MAGIKIRIHPSIVEVLRDLVLSDRPLEGPARENVAIALEDYLNLLELINEGKVETRRAS